MSAGKIKNAALIAGIGWLLIIVTGITSEFLIRIPMIDAVNPALTAANLKDGMPLFRLSVILDLIMVSLDITVGWALYRILYSTNAGVSLYMFVMRLTQSVIIALNTLLLVITGSIISNPEYAAELGAGQFQLIIMMLLNAHGSGYDIALVFFGIHLVVLGFLIIKSGFLPKVPGILLLFASIGYIADSVANLVLPEGSELISITASVLILTAVIAEVTISVFLVVKRNKLEYQAGIIAAV